MPQQAWRSENNLWESGKRFYHLAGPTILFLKFCLGLLLCTDGSICLWFPWQLASLPPFICSPSHQKSPGFLKFLHKLWSVFTGLSFSTDLHLFSYSGYGSYVCFICWQFHSLFCVDFLTHHKCRLVKKILNFKKVQFEPEMYVAQFVECLPNMHESLGLGSVPSSP